MRPETSASCECCGKRQLYRKLIEDQPGEHEYPLICEVCGHEHASWIERHHPIVRPQEEGTFAWAGGNLRSVPRLRWSPSY